MFFILSKTIGYLVRPLILVALIFVAHFIIKNQVWKKRLLITGFLMLFLFSNRFIANEVIRLFEAPPVPLAELETA